ncbi:Aldehyde dehydrogenase [[Actinomadura] parvosata subsp. kistnae]|uniref:aldehyde dehydrogenase (NAD(+)) n=1 Tax=[Actinomadura] parvosata subsp. kistnae TaxID=1909395 RepID=A0A1V0AHP0_9ACTN|nr:aldehyde dehydrogenase family protein [Nonomuraea sp. ATCC 55076]AQZ69727.1 aldehyde dehydrogenase family protein [Nonomuraea sp. ATCC 55076]SPL91548.1 Aldehyde dehydrogenase [Actinomadura parvosata subsp. kistnae]
MRQLYISGSWTASASDDSIDVVNPATEEIIDRVPAGSPDDVEAAAAAARKAFPAWSETAASERGKLLAHAADLLKQRSDEIAKTIATDMGAPLGFALRVQTLMPAGVLASYARLAESHPRESRVGNSLVVKEPIGVVAAITPWNYPLHQIVCKVAPALAAGCTVVLKPSEVAPLAAYALAEIFDEVGLPPGVFNLVSGRGPVVGEAMAAHPEIDMVSFTGSTAAGRRVAALAAESVKRVALELGGKSANVILPGADLPLAVKVGVANCFVNAGQTCSAWSRMIVQRDQYDEAVHLAVEAARGYRVGDPFDESTKIGPLVSATQRDRVIRYVNRGQEEGARLVAGGTERPHERGYYVEPTVFAAVEPGMTIEQEEIFGPVLALIPYTTEDNAVEIANDTKYGLAGAVWAATEEHAVAVARRLRTGQVSINGGRFNPMAPFGGYKQSGVGRELGEHGLEEYLEVKSLQL